MTELEIYRKCLGLGMTPAGAAGCTANIMAESAGRPDNVEDTYNSRLGVSDAEYVRQVDAGERDFLAPGQGGFGLCQWTSLNRRKALYDYLKGHGVSIGDADMQFQFMVREMRASYTYVWSVLTTTTDPYKAGYTMCKWFEIPANTEASSQSRGARAREILARCAASAEPEEPKQEERYWPPRMICKGMSGADVIVLQAILAARGYCVTAINGVFEDSTDKAVRKFQKENGLDVDGISGPKTWEKLIKY